MSFLYIEDGVVRSTEEGLVLPQVQAVYSADRSTSKKFFNDVIRYVFFVYKKDGVYQDLFLGYRKKLVLERHLPDRTEEDFEKNLRVVALIEEYQQRQLSKAERLLFQLECDMESLLKKITEIPYTKKVKVNIPVIDSNGNEQRVTTIVDMENYDEKAKAIMLADKMVDYQDKLRAKVIKEKSNERGVGQMRLFDKTMK